MTCKWYNSKTIPLFVKDEESVVRNFYGLSLILLNRGTHVALPEPFELLGLFVHAGFLVDKNWFIIL